MGNQHEFFDLSLEGIPALKEQKLAEGWRAVQILCTNCGDEGIEIVYTFAKDNVVENHIVHGVTKADTVPSITDAYIGMFPFENEAHDLFGVNVEGIAIDFGGRFYDLAESEPMTVISVEKKAALEKAAKAKAAAEAKAKAATDSQVAPVEAKSEPSIEEQRAAMEAKLAAMDPDKAAKVRAAFEAKIAKMAKEGE